jgi:hypothetical protein
MDTNWITGFDRSAIGLDWIHGKIQSNPIQQGHWFQRI